MAEVIGPTSTMPGYSHELTEGATCDLHPRRKAVARIQGETDSMGAELNDMCEECLKEHREEMRNADTSGECEWCRKHADELRETRDYEEGMAGRIYMVCAPCRKRVSDEADAYLVEMEDRFGDLDWPEDD